MTDKAMPENYGDFQEEREDLRKDLKECKDLCKEQADNLREFKKFKVAKEFKTIEKLREEVRQLSMSTQVKRVKELEEQNNSLRFMNVHQEVKILDLIETLRINNNKLTEVGVERDKLVVEIKCLRDYFNKYKDLGLDVGPVIQEKIKKTIKEEKV